jgi:hypothetical protein
MAYTFAISYMNQYPSEKTEGSRFACDPNLRNAKFASSLQALAVPISNEEQTIFNQLDFIHTASSCRILSISRVTESSTTTLPLLSCSALNGTRSATVHLPQQHIIIKAILSDSQVVGGVRMGLSGPGRQNGTNTLQELKFLHPFFSQSAQTFAQVETVGIALTKVS